MMKIVKNHRFSRFMTRNLRKRRGITFKGHEGRIWRRGAVIGGALLLLIMIMIARGGEPQLMNSPEISIVMQKGVLTVGVLEGIPGFSDQGEGLEIELAKLLAKRIFPDAKEDRSVNFVTVTSTTVGPRLDDGSIDVAIALMKRGTSTKYAYSRPYYTDKTYLAVREGNESSPIRNITVGYVFVGKSMSEPTVLSDFVKANPDANIERKPYASYDDMLQDLMANRINAAMIYGVYANKYRAQYGFSLSDTQLAPVEYAIACAADSPAFARLADIMLEEEKGRIIEPF